MKPEDNKAYLAAYALAFAGMLVGYYVPIIGTILTFCLLLVVIAALLGDSGGAIAELVAQPFVALGRWLARKDENSWVRRAPLIGLVAGWLMHWIIGGLTATGGT